MSILTIENLFKLLVIDIKNIFSLDIDVVESTSSKSHFSSNKAKGEDKYRIYYSKDAGKAEIHTVEDLMQYVVIFGHELTHCINKHNAFRSSLKEENVAIESIKSNFFLGDYGSYVSNLGIGMYSHNLLSAWVDLGLFGFVFYILILVYIII